MSYPGGQQGPQYIDPLTGQPLPPGQQSQGPGQQQGVPQPPTGGYQGFGTFASSGNAYSPPPGTPGNGGPNRTPLIIGVTVAIVLVIGIVTAVLVLNSGDDKQASPATTAASTTTRESSPTDTTTTTTTTTTSSGPLSTAPAVTSGWQGVLVAKDKIVYDVPSDWKIETPGTLVGYEDSTGKPKVVMHGVAQYKEDFCGSGSWRARVGAMSGDTVDPATAARGAARLWSQAYTEETPGSTASEAAPTQVKVAGGAIDATQVVTTITLATPDSCGTKGEVFTSVAFAVNGQTKILVVHADTGVPDALPPETVTQIIASARPAAS